MHAAEVRMRPVVMMCLSACIGLLPAAISTGIGSETQRPLATVIVGGMLLTPVLILLVIPVLISLLPAQQEVYVRESSEPKPQEEMLATVDGRLETSKERSDRL